jgi:hypothetical protein
LQHYITLQYYNRIRKPQLWDLKNNTSVSTFFFSP